MKHLPLIALLTHGLALAAQAARILLGNDDGWAELYVRSFHDALVQAGHSVILSCPADNKSGSGSRDVEPTPRSTPCQYNSCIAPAGPYGSNTSSPSLHWVNSYPVTAIRYGIETFAPLTWSSFPPSPPSSSSSSSSSSSFSSPPRPDIVLSGPNVGPNLFLQLPFSGTVAIASYAAHSAHIPAIAFSASSRTNRPWHTRPPPRSSTVYARLATFLTSAVLASGSPYLPDGVFLNVNFPAAKGECTRFESFKWVLSRVDPGWLSPPDVLWCGRTRLPTEVEVMAMATAGKGCYVAVSVADARDKTTVNDARQDVVLDKLRHILTCLPGHGGAIPVDL